MIKDINKHIGDTITEFLTDKGLCLSIKTSLQI